MLKLLKYVMYETLQSSWKDIMPGLLELPTNKLTSWFSWFIENALGRKIAQGFFYSEWKPHNHV